MEKKITCELPFSYLARTIGIEKINFYKRPPSINIDTTIIEYGPVVVESINFE